MKPLFELFRKITRSPFPLIKLFMKKFILAVCLFVFAFGAKARQNDTTLYHSSLVPGEINIPVVNAPDPFFEPWPQYPGGISNLYKYLSAHFQYPVIAKQKNIQGRVIISLIVEKDGSVSNTKIEQGVSHELDNEALRLVNTSPKWKPGTLKGKPVRVQRTLPLNFVLAGNKISY
jgi:TonB family protein